MMTRSITKRGHAILSLDGIVPVSVLDMSRRVQIRGVSGAGKTTLARALATRLEVPHVELDALVHGPGWTAATPPELWAELEPLLAGSGWVVDGNYSWLVGTRISEQADVVLWLDLPLRICLARSMRRTIARIRNSQELWHGNRQ